jgi:hypothetical protein
MKTALFIVAISATASAYMPPLYMNLFKGKSYD